MENVGIVIMDLDYCIWEHLNEEPELTAKALGIKEVVEFSDEFYDFFNSFLIRFQNEKVTMGQTLNLIEEKMPILYFYGYTPSQFLLTSNRMKFLCNELNKDALELIKYLSKKGIKNIVKTDWWRYVQEDMLHTYGILDYIEELHCCDNAYLKSNPLSKEGIIKPGKEEQYVIIGDSLTSDVAFAQHAGIKSIWFNKDGKNENNTPFKPTYEVPSLLDVMKII